MLADGCYATITTPSSEEGIEVVDVVRVRWIERPLLGCLTCEHTALQCSCASAALFGSPNLGIEPECIAVFVDCRVWLASYTLGQALHCSPLAIIGGLFAGASVRGALSLSFSVAGAFDFGLANSS